MSIGAAPQVADTQIPTETKHSQWATHPECNIYTESFPKHQHRETKLHTATIHCHWQHGFQKKKKTWKWQYLLGTIIPAPLTGICFGSRSNSDNPTPSRSYGSAVFAVHTTGSFIL